MNPMSWTMFVLSCLALVTAFVMRFRRSSQPLPLRSLAASAVLFMYLGIAQMWNVIEGGRTKYPNPVFRVLASTFLTASGVLSLATFVAERRKQRQQRC